VREMCHEVSLCSEVSVQTKAVTCTSHSCSMVLHGDSVASRLLLWTRAGDVHVDSSWLRR